MKIDDRFVTPLLQENGSYWIYILKCKNGAYYTGYTHDIVRRYREHVTGTAKCKYTRSFKPVNIAQCWQWSGNKSTAMKIEKFIKKMKRKDKLQLILNPKILSEMFGCKTVSADDIEMSFND
ncbi:MAG TPA: GIY-YIG nuclease family protein [Gammaproteobacteria bacterium]|nr:GIY-YIG nuclease family protein [Gammaproteobacteria bacterium]